MTRTATAPGTGPTLSADGGVHLAFFDKRTQLSYVWDGSAAFIEVSLWGYGEPVTETIDAPTIGTKGFHAVVLDFYGAVTEHATKQPRYQDR